MILTRLTLTNFGVFRGRQSIALQPQKGKPIVLIGGKNGAGKTTFLEAIRLCFYGSQGLGFNSRDEYLKYLDGRIHTNTNSIIQPNAASVAVEFQYSDSEAVHSYKVSRFWERRSTGKVIETLTVERNGKPLDDVAAEYWPEFVRDLIPPGVAQLFFFDGEKIQHLADDTTDQRELSDAMKALLGLDVVERLGADLEIYRSRVVKTLRDVEGGRDVEELTQELQHLESTLGELRKVREGQEATITDLRGHVVRVQDKITAQGGSFVRNREKLVHDKAVLETQITQVEAALREMCGGLLPFMLVPQLCEQLRQQLAAEQSATESGASEQIVGATKTLVVGQLDTPEFWIEFPKLSPAVRKKLKSRIGKLFDEVGKAENANRTEPVHQLSSTLIRQVTSWLDGAMELKKNVLQQSAELERLSRELHRVQEELRKVPPDELLKPLLEELQRVNTDLGEAGKNAVLTDDKIKNAELELTVVRRRYSQSVEKLASRATQGSRVQLVPKIQQVLSEFKSALLSKKLIQLQTDVTTSFNALCRKKDSVREITINSSDFSVVFKSQDQRPIPKSQLSAGEKQIYAISMLWGLAKTSGRPLPIIIDTPLGRLDTDHRRLLTEHYFPFASHQVIILSTDSEIDQVYFGDLRRSISQAYRLDFSKEDRGTRVNSGYFWNHTHEANEVTTHN
jgi:DNA sulfur modification protein DndD